MMQRATTLSMSESSAPGPPERVKEKIMPRLASYCPLLTGWFDHSLVMCGRDLIHIPDYALPTPTAELGSTEAKLLTDTMLELHHLHQFMAALVGGWSMVRLPPS
jgi:hypothetical protein